MAEHEDGPSLLDIQDDEEGGRSVIRVTSPKSSKPGLHLDDQALQDGFPKNASVAPSPDSEQHLNTFLFNTMNRSSPCHSQKLQPAAKPTTNGLQSTDRSSHAFKTTDRLRKLLSSPETHSTLVAIESPESMLKMPVVPHTTKNSSRPKLPPLAIPTRLRSDPPLSQLASAGKAVKVGKLYSIINNNLDSSRRAPSQQSSFHSARSILRSPRDITQHHHHTLTDTKLDFGSPGFFKKHRSAFKTDSRVSSPSIPFRPPTTYSQAFRRNKKDERSSYVQNSAGGISLSQVLANRSKHSLYRMGSQIDSVAGWSIYAMLPGTNSSDLGDWLQAQCRSSATNSVIVIPENTPVYLKNGLDLQNPVVLQGQPGSKLHIPQDQSIRIKAKDTVVFKEVEITLVATTSGTLQTEADQSEFDALFRIEHDQCSLELSDCAIKCEKIPHCTYGFWVARQRGESPLLWLKSCSISHFAYGIVAKQNAIINIEKSHFIQMRGAAIAATDPVWCKMVNTVVDNCGAHGISITLTHDCVQKVQRNIQIQGNVLTHCGGSAVHISGRPQPHVSFESDQNLFTRGLPEDIGSLVIVDANTPLAYPDPASCSHESVHINVGKNKIWLNRRDGVSLRHIVVERLRVADNDIIDNRNSAIWMQRVRRGERARTFELSKNRCNKSHQDFGLYLFEVDDLLIEDCEMRENQACGVMLVGELPGGPSVLSPETSALRLSNIRLSPEPGEATKIFQPLLSSRRRVEFRNCQIEKNRDHGVYIIDYLGLVEFEKCQVKHNFQNGLMLSQRVERKEGGLSLLRLKQMHESGLIPRVKLGPGCTVRENWKHAVSLNFVQLTVTGEARVEVMGARDSGDQVEDSPSPQKNNLLRKYQEKKGGANSQNYAIHIPDCKSAWLLQVERDENQLSAAPSQRDPGDRPYAFPNVLGRIGGVRWGQYAAREEASMQSVMGYGAESAMPSTRRVFDKDGTPRLAPGSPAGLRQLTSPHQMIRSPDKISEKLDESGDAVSKPGSGCVLCASPKRSQQQPAAAPVEQKQEPKEGGAEPAVEIRKPRYKSALQGAIGGASGGGRQARQESPGGGCVCGKGKRNKRVGDLEMQAGSPRQCVIF